MAEDALEQRIRSDAAWRSGVECDSPGHGHPEARIIDHVEEVLGNVDRYAADPEQRRRLRLIALVHDAFKEDVRWWTGNHARIAHRFAREHVDDEGVLLVVRHHDDVYRAWRLARRTGLWPVARWQARRVVRRLGPHLDLFRVFYRCDNETGAKSPDDRLWFEAEVLRAPAP